MILGIGTDLADIRRIRKTLDRFGERFVRQVFTDAEQAKAAERTDAVAHYAKRWAAKEACAKALGKGLCTGVAWREISVTNLPTGRPVIELSGGAAKRLAAMTPEGRATRIHVTITDDPPYAQAFVVIEALHPDEVGEEI